MTKRAQARVELLDGMAFRGTPASGHAIVLDTSAEVGGRDSGPRPMELLLMGLGGCTGMDVISILRKMRQDVVAYEVRLDAQQEEEHPKVYTEIVVEHVVRGRALNPEMVRRAVELSATRYCPASAMLGKAARVEHRFRAVDVEAGTEVLGSIAEGASAVATNGAVVAGGNGRA